MTDVSGEDALADILQGASQSLPLTKLSLINFTKNSNTYYTLQIKY